MSMSITISINTNIKQFLYDRYQERKIENKEILSKLKDNEITFLSLSDIEKIKKELEIKNYAIFYSNIVPISTEIKFRNISGENSFLKKSINEVIEWVILKREQYIECVEQLEQDIPSFQVLIGKSREFYSIEEKASYIRGKIQNTIDNKLSNFHNKNLLLRNLIFGIENIGCLVFSDSYGTHKDSGADGFSLNYLKLPIINFNTSKGISRTLFTLAHELGHLIMHKDSTYDLSIDYQSLNKEEIEANSFAAFFLMPRQEVINKLEQFKKNKKIKNYLKNLKNYFNTSIDAIYYHLKNLNLITNEIQLEYDAYKKKPSKGGGKITYPFSTIIKYGCKSTYNLLLARNLNKIDEKFFLNFFKDRKQNYSLGLKSIEKDFLSGDIL